jgi:rRNA biogenesis protein RRP5
MFYFKQTRLEDGRFTFTRALQSLDKRDVAETAVKFAQIEFKYGDAERGKHYSS